MIDYSGRTWVKLVLVCCMAPLFISPTVSSEPQQPGKSGQRGFESRDNRVKGKGSNDQGRGKGGSGLGNYTEPPPVNKVPEHLYNIILGRPTDDQITIRVLFHKAAKARVVYGIQSDNLIGSTTSLDFQAKDTHDFVINELQPDKRYFFQLIYRSGNGSEQRSNKLTFHTQRAVESPFVFTVTADSHLDENTSGQVYLRTLKNASMDSPDFHFELGDTFMTGKYVSAELAEPQYLAQRYYLGSLCHSAALFLALGNHDGESGNRGSIAWATRTRQRLFPNPEPDGFYTGNDQAEPGIGLPQNYYQWTWGAAQFIVLDPFRYTTARGRSNSNWVWTLGKRQYQWLKSSLENTDVKYRFVFIHHLVGGSPMNNRGGVEVARLWEWGGENMDGVSEFDQQRPGWELPIHDLLVKHGVSIVFHGHDHLFVKQELDGIVYQEVPQPGHPRSGNTNTAIEYGYVSGEVQSSSGHVRVRVRADEARVDYVRTYLPEAETTNRRNGEVSFSYTLRPSESQR